MTVPAQKPLPDDGEVVPFVDPDARIRLLEAENAALKTQNEALLVDKHALVLQNSFLSRFILYLGKKYFSSDDKARYYAGLAGRGTSEVAARKHWARHGGRERYEADFPSAMCVIRHFTRSQEVRHRLQQLLSLH